MTFRLGAKGHFRGATQVGDPTLPVRACLRPIPFPANGGVPAAHTEGHSLVGAAARGPIPRIVRDRAPT